MLESCLAKDTWERPTAEQLSDYAVKRQKGEPAAFRWDRQEPQREAEARKTVVLKDVGDSGYMNGMQNRPKEMEVREIRVGNVQFKMMPVAGGKFMMGADEKQASWAAADEKPVHEVALSDYYIGQYPVTQGLWRAVTGRNPSNNKAGDDYPVEYVSWDDCQGFIKKLNARTGLEFRLPREAEWEYAARGGRQSRGFIYSGSDNADEVAWHAGNSSLGFWKGRRTHPVGQKKPNELGLYDMSGNVSRGAGGSDRTSIRGLSRASRGRQLARCQELPGFVPEQRRPWLQVRQRRPPPRFVPLVKMNVLAVISLVHFGEWLN